MHFNCLTFSLYDVQRQNTAARTNDVSLPGLNRLSDLTVIINILLKFCLYPWRKFFLVYVWQRGLHVALDKT